MDTEVDIRRTVAEALARDSRVERLVIHVTGRPLDADTEDLCQIVYERVLTYAPDKIADLWDNDQMDFFLVRVIRNQYFSKTSPYYRKIRSFAKRTQPIQTRDDTED